MRDDKLKKTKMYSCESPESMCKPPTCLDEGNEEGRVSGSGKGLKVTRKSPPQQVANCTMNNTFLYLLGPKEPARALSMTEDVL